MIGAYHNNGFDSFYYDTTTYDSARLHSSKKLNRYYEFINASDGDTVANRKFRLYVVGDDSCSDNTIMQVEQIFTADIST